MNGEFIQEINYETVKLFIKNHSADVVFALGNHGKRAGRTLAV